MDEFHILTEKDKNHIAYGLCVGSFTLTGMAVGGFGGLKGVLVGGAAGFLMGLAACPYLEEPIKRKLFSPTAQLSDEEFLSALRAIRDQEPFISKSEAMDLLAEVRHEIARQPQKYNQAIAG